MVKSRQIGGRAMPRATTRESTVELFDGSTTPVRSRSFGMLATVAVFAAGIASCTYLFLRDHATPAYVVLGATVLATVGILLNARLEANFRRQSQPRPSPEINLAQLRAYRERDPLFQSAIARFADAEVSIADPLEGEAFEEDSEPMGPAQTKIRELLDA